MNFIKSALHALRLYWPQHLVVVFLGKLSCFGWSHRDMYITREMVQPLPPLMYSIWLCSLMIA
jgi:hypothetical protein